MDKRLTKITKDSRFDEYLMENDLFLVDTYNQSFFTDICPTIKQRIDQNNNIRIVEKIEDIDSNKIIVEKCRFIGNIYGSYSGKSFAGNIYDQNFISPTLMNMTGGNRQPLIMEKSKEHNIKKEELKITEPLKADDEGLCRPLKSQYYKTSRSNFESHGSFGATGVQVFALENSIEPAVLRAERTEYGKAMRKSVESGEQKISRHELTELQPRTDGISNTLTGVQKDNLLAEPSDEKEPSLHIPQATSKGYIECPPGGVFDASYPDSKLRRGRVQNGKKLLPTLTCGAENGLRYYEKYEPKVKPSYRIRKLTPRECFRLMGVSDANIDIIQKAEISNSQQYKMAGNSIVVDTLACIFRKLFIDKESDEQQMNLF